MDLATERVIHPGALDWNQIKNLQKGTKLRSVFSQIPHVSDELEFVEVRPVTSKHAPGHCDTEIVVKNKIGLEQIIYPSDMGLVPYPNGWNPNNYFTLA